MSRIVAALGGNALLPRDAMEETGSASGAQEANVATAADIIAGLAHHSLVVTHGNGPQVGLLALQTEAAGTGTTLDVLGA
ncbi:MAG: carbamate kinase, partial [Longimicrobiales bacterium]|nr:carbamate kinase [Longimicrobiales bacterium]